jgi:hypothetical protein
MLIKVESYYSLDSNYKQAQNRHTKHTLTGFTLLFEWFKLKIYINQRTLKNVSGLKKYAKFCKLEVET